jgi:hypothetical protein
MIGFLTATAGTVQPGPDPWPRVDIADVYTRDAAKRSLTGAYEWLAKPACRSIFSEFEDGRGLPLTDRLEELSVTPDGYLQLVVFLDGERKPACKRHGVLAFTEPGSRVVYLCGRDFERAARRNPSEARMTIIHELLHSLGLRENPPSPRSINYRIQQSCS